MFIIIPHKLVNEGLDQVFQGDLNNEKEKYTQNKFPALRPTLEMENKDLEQSPVIEGNNMPDAEPTFECRWRRFQINVYLQSYLHPDMSAPPCRKVNAEEKRMI